MQTILGANGQIGEELARELKRNFTSNIRIPKFIFRMGAIFNQRAKELLELLPRYEHNNVFDDSKFRKRFPDFKVTTYRQGIKQIKNEQLSIKQQKQ